jgi:hypothetical protein
VKKQEAVVNATSRDRKILDRRNAADEKRKAGKEKLVNTVSNVVDKSGDLVGAIYATPDRAVAAALQMEYIQPVLLYHHQILDL